MSVRVRPDVMKLSDFDDALVWYARAIREQIRVGDQCDRPHSSDPNKPLYIFQRAGRSYKNPAKQETG